jgi:hypothetical protein
MNVKELYDHITKHMTAEQALMKLLEGHVLTYDKLKFQEGEEIHPTILVVMAAMDMGWNLAIPDTGNDDDELQGMAIGTQEYLDKLFPEDNNDFQDAEEN